MATLKESGIDLVADSWYGMWLPAGSPPEFARQLSTAVAAVLPSPTCGRSCRRSASFRSASTRKDLHAELAANTAFWQPIVKATGYKITN